MSDITALKEALDIYQTQYSQTDHLWNYFGTVTLAVLGFSIGSDKATRSFTEASALVVGYFTFCLGNYSALRLAQKQLIEFSNLAIEVAKAANRNLLYLEPLPICGITIFYWVVVIAVIVGILFITYTREKSQ